MQAGLINADGANASPERTRNVRLIATVALAVSGVLVASAAAIELDRARMEQATQQASLDKASQDLVSMRAARQHAREAAFLMGQADAQGLSLSQWSSRVIDIEQAQTSRADLNALLEQTRRSPARFLDADSFDVAVAGAGEGLFEPPHPPGKALVLTFKATLHFRTGLSP